MLVAQRSSGLTSHAAGPGTQESGLGSTRPGGGGGGGALAHYKPPFILKRAEMGNGLQAGRPEQG